MRKIESIVIHCSATKENEDYNLHQLRRGHLKRGFSDVGYHYYIRKNGDVNSGRDVTKPGAHVRGHNRRTIGVCYEGGLDVDGNPKDTRTDAQKRELEFLLISLKTLFNDAEIKGHRDYSKDLDGDGIVEKHEWMKACPCFDAIEEYKNL